MSDRAYQYRPSRRQTDVPATLCVDETFFDGRVRDISRDGAKISVTQMFEVGTAVVLIMDDVAVPAIVHWSKDGHTGLRFLDRLDGDTLLTVERAADMLAAWR